LSVGTTHQPAHPFHAVFHDRGRRPAIRSLAGFRCRQRKAPTDGCTRDKPVRITGMASTLKSSNKTARAESAGRFIAARLNPRGKNPPRKNPYRVLP
jgi:hypothetical protein